jgi:hypothetical protein
LNRTDPRRAGTRPSECCSKSAANRVTCPFGLTSICRIVKNPVSVFDPRCWPVMSIPGLPTVRNAARCAPRYCPAASGTLSYGERNCSVQ